MSIYFITVYIIQLMVAVILKFITDCYSLTATSSSSSKHDF